MRSKALVILTIQASFPRPLISLPAHRLLRFTELNGDKVTPWLVKSENFFCATVSFFPARHCRFKPATDLTEARSLVEIPISVAGVTRMPWLGTTLTLAPDAIGQMLTKAVLKRSAPAILRYMPLILPMRMMVSRNR